MTRAPTRQVRLADVAQAAGVGTSIVSRVLNGDATLSIRPETRERILAAARDLNYRPNAFARGLKLARTMTLGLVIPNLAYPVNAEIIRGAERRAASAGYVVLLADSEEFLQAGEAFERLLRERRVDGLLIASASTDEAVVRALARAGLPFVLVNRRVGRVGPSVTVDDVRGMKIGVEHLISLGHRRIAYIGGPADADTARRRLAGFRAAMRGAQLRAPAARVAEAPFDEEGGFRAMVALLERRPRPTAVAVWSLAAAVGALAAAREQGVHVPGELSIVAFHDAPMASYLDPPLTTVRMPLREMAERGVESLLALIDGEAVQSVVVGTAPMLIQRASTRSPAPD
jgi:LacI family transcriptional regulator, galactose operon repressor